MPLWRLFPVADADDPRWQDRDIWETVIVRADTSAAARLAAERLDTEPEKPSDGNGSESFNSGFSDEKLYWVARLHPSEAADLGSGHGPAAVLHAAKREKNRRPLDF